MWAIGLILHELAIAAGRARLKETVMARRRDTYHRPLGDIPGIVSRSHAGLAHFFERNWVAERLFMNKYSHLTRPLLVEHGAEGVGRKEVDAMLDLIQRMLRYESERRIQYSRSTKETNENERREKAVRQEIKRRKK